jgi:cytochrome c556
MIRYLLVFAAMVLLFPVSQVMAGETPQEVRHELMEGMKDAAKPVGMMLKGEQAFDAATAMESFQTWSDTAARVSDLFPVGSETGFDTRALETVWSDREGFDAALLKFKEAVSAAVAASPQDLAALKAAAGPVFSACKNCHEDYRAEEEE